MRKDKINYYLDIAQAVTERSTCLRRHYGCIIVKNDEIIATGYNGAPRGRKNCDELGYCYREKMQIPRGKDTNYVEASMLNRTLSYLLLVKILSEQLSTCVE